MQKFNLFKKSLIKNWISSQKIKKLHHLRWFLQHIYLRVFFAGNLYRIAKVYDAGKPDWFLDYYAQIFSDRSKIRKIVEIGIGGYSHHNTGGQSLRTWHTYFPHSKVFGLDIVDKSYHQNQRIRTFVCDQSSEEQLHSFAKKNGHFDVIIDDGSHRPDHVILSFITLFPFLKSGGVYIVEDIQSSYWPEWGGATNPEEYDSVKTTVGYFKKLIHGLNYEEYDIDTYNPTEYDKTIVGINFYHNLIVIEKGDNNNGSNMMGKRW